MVEEQHLDVRVGTRGGVQLSVRQEVFGVLHSSGGGSAGEFGNGLGEPLSESLVFGIGSPGQNTTIVYVTKWLAGVGVEGQGYGQVRVSGLGDSAADGSVHERLVTARYHHVCGTSVDQLGFDRSSQLEVAGQFGFSPLGPIGET